LLEENNKKMCRILSYSIVLLSFLVSCKPSKTTSSKDASPIIETIGGRNVSVSEFTYVYNKNNAKAPDAYSAKSLKEYLDLYTNFRLKVREAEELGLDTTESFKKELEGYKKQLAQPYLTEKGVTEQLTKEAYERMKEEVNASHILINVTPEADPKDTLAAYNKISGLRQRAVSGESFEKLAVEFSEDPSAKTNKGSLGYFTALQMVYPFEDAAFKTKKGDISKPVRTRFGYHIIKVNERRPSQGQIRVAHIMVRTTPGSPAEDSLAAKQKSEEIYNRLKKGEEWNTLSEQFSDDANSKSKGGELPWFSTGRMIPNFEDAAFALKNVGDYSQPINTPYGWHIIKLLEKKPLESFADLEPTLKTKVSKDSRSELNRSILLQRLKKENQFVENPQTINNAVSLADSSLVKGTWEKKADEKANGLLFTIGTKRYLVNDFFTYLSNNRSSLKSTASPSQAMRNAYKKYVDEELIKYEESHLEQKYVDYKMLVKEYRDGILLFQLMDEKVWSKAISDTTGLRNYYDKNKEKYRWDTRANAKIFSVSNETTLERLKKELKNERFPVKNKSYEPITFESGKSTLSEENIASLKRIANDLNREKSNILEVTVKSDAKESKNAGLAAARGKAIRSQLIANKADSTRIIIKEQNKLVAPKGNKDATLNKKAEFALFSKSPKVLEADFNQENALTLQVNEGVFQKADNENLANVDWKPGEYTSKKNDRISYVLISKIEEPRAKTFEEARGLIISDYQNYLEQEWISALKAKYPVAVNEAEFQKLIKK
jgi:peptidyl-prolyl cis-trans isomerase SurA